MKKAFPRILESLASLAFLKNFAIFKEKHPVLESLFHKVVSIEVFSSEYCKIVQEQLF